MTFACLNENGNYVDWNIDGETKSLYSVSLTHFNPIGMKYTRILLSSSFTAEVNAINSTYMASTLTISGISTLIQTTVSCNGMEEMLDNLINPTIDSK